MYIPENVKFIIDTFKEHNYEAFIVGGSVRDSLLNRKVHDYDITTNALPEVTQDLFKKTIPTGIKHGTITVILDKEPFEITTYRIDGEYIDNRKPEEVIFVTDIEKDLSRRDFTINAMAYSPYLGLKDYFNGKDDLQNKLIKAVGDPSVRFDEDALRILRAIRFSSQLGFDIEEKTLSAIKEKHHLIDCISRERIRDEIIKMLLSVTPSIAFNTMYDCNLLIHLFDNYTKKISDFTTLNILPQTLYIRLTFLMMLFYDDIELTLNSLKNLRFDNNIIRDVKSLINCKKVLNISTRKELKKYLSSYGENFIINAIDYYTILDSKSKDKAFSLKSLVNEIIKAKEPISLKDLKIDGKDLISTFKIKGKLIGSTLDYLLDVVLEAPELNEKQNLLKLVEKRLELIK